MSILRACVRCGALSDQPHCEAHRIDPRPPSQERGYDHRWRRIAKRYLRRHPVCEEDGCNAPATCVDHIDGRGPRGDNSDANLRALCHSCHSRKTVRHDGGFGRPVDRL